MPTIPDSLYDPDGRVSLAVYDYLEDATPEERTEMVLKLIEAHCDGQLELPERDGKRAYLSGIDISQDAIAAHIGGCCPPMWAIQLDGRWVPHLAAADLQGAVLSDANLQGAMLTGARLQKAKVGNAHLQSADLSDADLMEIEGYDTHLEGAYLRGAKMQGSYLVGVHLERALMWSTHLEEATLLQPHLEKTSLAGAYLEGATLMGADLRGAQLNGAHLERLDLSTASLAGVRVSEAWLDHTRFTQSQLGDAIGDELDKKYAEARNGYLILKQNFDSLGDYAGASWAYCKERRMEKLEALQKGLSAECEGNWPQALKCLAKAALDQLIELVCDYGESLWRVLICLAIVWFDFALLYAITGHVLADRGTQYVTTRNLVDLASFSLGTMVTIEPPGLIAYDSLLMRIAMPAQAFVSIFLAGLLGFVAGNRIRRS